MPFFSNHCRLTFDCIFRSLFLTTDIDTPLTTVDRCQQTSNHRFLQLFFINHCQSIYVYHFLHDHFQPTSEYPTTTFDNHFRPTFNDHHLVIFFGQPHVIIFWWFSSANLLSSFFGDHCWLTYSPCFSVIIIDKLSFAILQKSSPAISNHYLRWQPIANFQPFPLQQLLSANLRWPLSPNFNHRSSRPPLSTFDHRLW